MYAPGEGARVAANGRSGRTVRSERSSQDSPNPERWLAPLSNPPLEDHFTRMPIPALPAELLIKIVDLAAPEPNFDFAQPAWAADVEQNTLHALCLTSRVFNEIATSLLYRHLVLPTPEAGLALVRTLQSDRWQTRKMVGKAKGWVRSAILGREVEGSDREEGGFVEQVLDHLAGSGLERLAVVGLEVDWSVLSQIAGSDVLNLRLDQVVVDCAEGASVSLPQLSHLHLTDFTIPALTPDRTFRPNTRLNNVLLCPSLTHLACTKPASARPRLPRHRLLLPQPTSSLRSVAFNLDTYVFLHELVHAAPGLVALRELALGRAQPEWDLVDGVRQLLAGLPHSLEILDVSGVGAPNFTARVVGWSFECGARGVSGLRVLRLAREQVQSGGELSGLVEIVEARGVMLEWV